MAKPLTGSVKYDARRNRWCARINPTDPETGKERVIRRYHETKTGAERLLRGLLNQYEAEPLTLRSGQMTFAQLATEYRRKKLIPAKYVGERKIAGLRSLGAPATHLKNAEDFFGAKKLSTIKRVDLENYRLHLADKPTFTGRERTLGTINQAMALTRTVLNYAVHSGYLARNPFHAPGTGKLIDASGEAARDRLPTFGEEIALLAACVGKRAYLRPLIIVAADTGLRQNELLTLAVNDLDFEGQQIRLRAINAKTNKARVVPMTQRVDAALREVVDAWSDGTLFGARDINRAWRELLKAAGIVGLHWHDWRHALISRAILAGVPLTMVLSASGHSHNSGEWLRYSNLSAGHLKGLLKPHGDQPDRQVKDFARDVLLGLREALGYSEIEKLLEM